MNHSWPFVQGFGTKKMVPSYNKQNFLTSWCLLGGWV